MPEIFELADRYTVFRNGEFIGDGAIDETTPEEVTGLMVGENYSAGEVYEKRKPGEVVLELHDFSGPGFEQVSLQVKKGRSSDSPDFKAPEAAS